MRVLMKKQRALARGRKSARKTRREYLGERRGPKRTTPQNSVQTSFYAPKDLLRDVQVLAVKRGTSMSRMLIDAMENLTRPAERAEGS